MIPLNDGEAASSTEIVFPNACRFRTDERISIYGPPQQQTYIARLILRVQDSLRQLGVDVDVDGADRKIEAMSILIHESMSISSRNFHSVQHVFDISRNLRDPVAVLAALFHDCVYYHVDGGLTGLQQRKLAGAVEFESSLTSAGLVITDTDVSTYPLLYMVKKIFGYSTGQAVSNMQGLNEFLSAIIAVRELQDFLPKSALAQIAACIEATIPFRGVNTETGETAMDRLYKRLQEVNQSEHLNMPDEEIVTAVQRACILANEDVENFGTSDRTWFLDNTWSLMTETNEALRHQHLYSVMEFQFAIVKMNAFFNFLAPSVVFACFRGVPGPQEMESKLSEAQRNLEVGRKYVGAKLLSTSLLAAFAVLTGGDAPISLFMGDLPSRHRVSMRLEDTLPTVDEDVLMAHCDMDVYLLLSEGRRTETAFDIKQSPLAAYLYGCLGDKGLEGILKAVKFYPMTPESANELLAILPSIPTSKIANQMAKVALSRAAGIRKIAADLLE
jgi:hypothetical protein